MLADFIDGLEKHMRVTKVGPDIPYPIEVSAVKVLGKAPRGERVGSWASVRPCSDETAGKTFLGVYLGDLYNGAFESYNTETKEVSILMNTNPALYVPDLQKIVWGCESWWGIIESEAKLRAITDLDIQNVWYVRALKELSGEGKSL